MSEYKVPGPNPVGPEFAEQTQRDLDRAARTGKERERAVAARRRTGRRWPRFLRRTRTED